MILSSDLIHIFWTFSHSIIARGDFWVKLRGAGLTYGSSISDSTDSQLLRFSLFKCTDVPAAFEAASNIITEYASGKAKVSAVGLENAKASLAYQIISGRSSKL